MGKQRWQDRVTVAVGVYVFFSPRLISLLAPATAVEGVANWSHYAVGAAIVAIGVAAFFSYSKWAEWAEAGLGTWLVGAPWILRFADNSLLTWSSIIVGLIVVAMSLASLVKLKVIT